MESGKKDVNGLLEDIKKTEEVLQKKRFQHFSTTLEEILKGSSFLDNACEMLEFNLKNKKEQKTSKEGTKEASTASENALKVFYIVIFIKMF